MAKSLLVVESPTKAKTLGRYLGRDFVVKASVGHVKDLPKNRLGIDIEKGFQAAYQVMSGKKKVLSELSAAAAKADAVYLGPDPDREGEAIAWHIAEEIRRDEKPFHRVLFYELTHKAVKEALKRPSELNRGLYEAQQARRILDRLVGYLISPILWQKVKPGLSAGRVQSVALRLVCEREDAIQQFNPEEYWTIEARLTPSETMETDSSENLGERAFTAILQRYMKKKCKVSREEEARGLVERLRYLPYKVEKVERKQKNKNPSPPFITSTLQQESARRLRFSAKKTMSLAQKLYEGLEVGNEGAVGLITYMRTDSTRLSTEAVDAARDYILETWGKDYLPPKAVFYKSKASAQGAHEAIRPTDVNRTPETVAPHLTKDQLALYSLIWKRFVACQMAPARISQTTVDIGAGGYSFRATGSVVNFHGYMKLYVESRENGENGEAGEKWLPELTEGQDLSLLEIIPKQHFTQPPPRFSEASLIRELEELGIGRPSTYATILSTIVERGYVASEKQRLTPTELGRIINTLLVESFPGIVDVEFTAQLEKSLDGVEEGQYPYLKLLEEFYDQFARTLESAKTNMLNVKAKGLPTDLQCPLCKHPLHIRLSRNGPFLACSDHPRCTFTADYERDEKGRIRVLERETVEGENCEKCGSPMVVKKGRYGTFLACSNYPKCKHTKAVKAGENTSAAIGDPGETCDKCGRPMVMKQGRFGAFLACSGYPGCKNTRPVATGIPCPQEGCDGQLVERRGMSGRRFYGCSRYPQCTISFRGTFVQEPCPHCGFPSMLEKQDKKKGARLLCPNPACGHEAEHPSSETQGAIGS
ncbi:MAG: type I DNA topoisomerase [Deltaproteobacteria bacterium]|nr:type I DNA topoisomerase [Deltaproteobacteria bacterium]